MLSTLNNKFEKQKVSQGVYLAEFDFNFNHELIMKGVKLKDRYGIDPIVEDEDNDRYIMPHGVCDDYQQILSYIPELLSSHKKYVIGLTLVKREWEEPDGGWRWCRWGEYIGTQNPQCEYIYDEPEIEQVYCYSIHEIV